MSIKKTGANLIIDDKHAYSADIYECPVGCSMAITPSSGFHSPEPQFESMFKRADVKLYN
jgi:hypothetical protein